jgi:hypothetical protein
LCFSFSPSKHFFLFFFPRKKKNKMHLIKKKRFYVSLLLPFTFF